MKVVRPSGERKRCLAGRSGGDAAPRVRMSRRAHTNDPRRERIALPLKCEPEPVDVRLNVCACVARQKEGTRGRRKMVFSGRACCLAPICYSHHMTVVKVLLFFLFQDSAALG